MFTELEYVAIELLTALILLFIVKFGFNKTSLKNLTICVLLFKVFNSIDVKFLFT